MFAYIKGIIDYKGNDFVIVDNGGIGYKIYTSQTSLNLMGKIGDEVKMHTYLHVREDIMLIYGFYHREELTLFELLTSVNGVGPKAALSLLSAHNYTKLSLAIASGDYKALKEAPGIGNKTAQRLVLELKDKVMKCDFYTQDVNVDDIAPDVNIDNSIASEACNALLALGYSKQDAENMIKKVYKDGMCLEEVIMCALKSVG